MTMQFTRTGKYPMYSYYLDVYALSNRLDEKTAIFNMIFILFVTCLMIFGLVLIDKKKLRRVWKENHFSETILSEVIGKIGEDKTQKRKDIVRAMRKGAVEGLAD
jgi:sulfite exporter TauE/SafE